jgi:protein-S-isoprenylcysteine O-methyltransferase Ste14
MALAIRLLIALALLAGLLFAAAGGWQIPAFWTYLALCFGFAVLVRLTVDRQLLHERLSSGTKGPGRYFRAVLAPFAVAHLVIAGLDVGRFRWSDQVPLPVQIGGFVGLALAMAGIWWAICVNRFFTPAILVQQEGQLVISTGPYQFVRHPGYSGMSLAIICSGLALSSYWSLLPAAGYVGLLILRTAQEDRILREKLPGYQPYAERVRFRLIPGVW